MHVRPHPAGFTLVETLILTAVLLVVVALAVPGFALLRQKARQTQNTTQLRGIAQGMETWSFSSKTGGGDGYYPGLGRSGETIPVDDLVPAAQLAAVADVPGYAAAASENVLPDEMNGPSGRGFIVRVMAELAAGDYIPASSASYFVNPADPVKTPFVVGDPGPAGRFDASKISYTTLDLSKSDGGVFPYKAAWKNADADPRRRAARRPRGRRRQRPGDPLQRLDGTQLGRVEGVRRVSRRLRLLPGRPKRDALPRPLRRAGVPRAARSAVPSTGT